jgi:hypothetical protein
MIIAMPRDTSQHTDRVYMEEICRELKRDRSTIVTWDNKHWLPEGLEFQRDENGWRYWSREQLERAREWVNSPAPARTAPSQPDGLAPSEGERACRSTRVPCPAILIAGAPGERRKKVPSRLPSSR